MSICGYIYTWFISLFFSFWGQIIFPLYSAIGAIPFVFLAFVLNLVYIYFLGRFIQSRSGSDGVRRRSPKKSGGDEE